MKTLNDLKNDAAKLADIAGRMAQAADAYRVEREKISGDTTRSQSWKAEQTKKLNEEIIPTVLQSRNEMVARFEEMQQVKPFFTTPLLVLAKEPYLFASWKPNSSADTRDQWAADEATVRTNIRAELMLLPKAAQKLWACAAAESRNWGAVYQAALVLGEELPYSLGSLPVSALETADQIFYDAEVAVRSAEVTADEIQGRRTSTRSIALSLLSQRHEERKLARQRGWSYTVDEKKALGFDTPRSLEQNLDEMRNPKPMNLTLPDLQSGAGFKPGKEV